MITATPTAQEQQKETRAIDRVIPLVKAILWLRGKILGSTPTSPRRPAGLVVETKSLG